MRCFRRAEVAVAVKGFDGARVGAHHLNPFDLSKPWAFGVSHFLISNSVDAGTTIVNGVAVAKRQSDVLWREPALVHPPHRVIAHREGPARRWNSRPVDNAN